MPQLAAGTDYVQLPADSSGKKSGFLLATVSGGQLYLPASVLVDAAGNTLDSAAAAPAGTERGLVVRPIPSGTQAVSAAQGGTGAYTASWTSGTGAPANLDAAVSGYASALVELNVPGTVTDGVVSFLGSADGGTNFYAVDAVRLAGSAAEQAYSVAGGSQMWQVPSEGFTHVRVQLSTAIAGSGTVGARVVPFALGAEPQVSAVPAPGRVATYVVAFTQGTGVTTASGTQYFFTLFHPSTLRRDVQVVRIELSVKTVAAGGSASTSDADILELLFISAENATPGGTTLTPQPTNRARAASGVACRKKPTGAPTTTGSAFWRNDLTTLTAGPQPVPVYNYDRTAGEEPIVLRASQAEGICARQVNGSVALTTAPVFGFTVWFKELF